MVVPSLNAVLSPCHIESNTIGNILHFGYLLFTYSVCAASLSTQFPKIFTQNIAHDVKGISFQYYFQLCLFCVHRNAVPRFNWILQTMNECTNLNVHTTSGVFCVRCLTHAHCPSSSMAKSTLLATYFLNSYKWANKSQNHYRQPNNNKISRHGRRDTKITLLR